MADQGIETFDVRIEGAADGYAVIADSSYGGTYRGRFRDRIDRRDVATLQSALRREAPHASRADRDVGVVDPASALDADELLERIGRTLFDDLFTGELEAGLRDTMALARRDGRFLRIRLRLESVPELGPLPWEALRDTERDRFVTLSGQTEVVRHLGRPEPVRQVAVRGPLRVLVVVSTPSDLPPIGAEHEWTALAEELAPLIAEGRLELVRIDPPTFAALQRALLEGPWHVLHFIGHGADEPASLAFCRDDGRADLVAAGTLAGALAGTVELRLALLNACHSARASDRDAFGGVAQELLQRSVPAVVAMQFAVSDGAAIAFAGRFYAAVAHGWAVDHAVGDARDVLAARGNEWVTPVLHLRGDGVLFDVDRTPPTQRRARRRALVAAAGGVALVLAGAAAWALTRPDAGDDAEDRLPVCPAPDGSWTDVPLAEDPRGSYLVGEGSLEVAASDVAWRPDGDGWLVVADVTMRNDTPEEVYIGEYLFPAVVVANRRFDNSCADDVDEAIGVGRTADYRVGFEVACPPTGQLELVAGDDDDLFLPITADTTPGDC